MSLPARDGRAACGRARWRANPGHGSNARHHGITRVHGGRAEAWRPWNRPVNEMWTVSVVPCAHPRLLTSTVKNGLIFRWDRPISARRVVSITFAALQHFVLYVYVNCR